MNPRTLWHILRIEGLIPYSGAAILIGFVVTLWEVGFAAADWDLFGIAVLAAVLFHIDAHMWIDIMDLEIDRGSRVPGTRAQTHPVEMNFKYGEVFGRPSPEAYERLLLDVMAGDASRFMRRDAVEASWAWITQILEAWEKSGQRWLPEYQAGTWGPVEADRLIQNDGRTWRVPDLASERRSYRPGRDRTAPELPIISPHSPAHLYSVLIRPHSSLK